MDVRDQGETSREPVAVVSDDESLINRTDLRPADGVKIEAIGDINQTKQQPGGWNWGAFFLTWIWGIPNKVMISLIGLALPLYFILAIISPMLASLIGLLLIIGNVVIAFILGAKGTKWAWSAQKEKISSEQFLKKQRKWAIAGCIVTLILFICMVANINFWQGPQGVDQYIELLGYTDYVDNLRQNLISGNKEWLVANAAPAIKESYSEAQIEKLVEEKLIPYFADFSKYYGDFSDYPKVENQMFEEAFHFESKSGEIKDCYLATIHEDNGDNFWLIIQPGATNYNQAEDLSLKAWAEILNQ
jgi:hypothetical protein